MSFPGLSGSVALVSGAASGIGAAVTQRLRDNGARVAACDLTPGIVRQTDGHHMDVTDSSAVDAVVASVEERFGPIDILANVAGVLRTNPLVDTTDSDWERMFAVNTSGVFHLTRAVARRMLPRRRGAIVTVASNAAGVPRTGMGGYAASKAAAAHLTRCFGLELAEAGIRCNVVAPGSTDTPMLRGMWDDDEAGMASTIDGDPASHRLGIPLRKLATPTDVADAVCFLASDAAGHLTLQELYVDGGAALR
jgi:2,3-dihydro-2,3-dihydroxybenzoate dehydrogenase